MCSDVREVDGWHGPSCSGSYSAIYTTAVTVFALDVRAQLWLGQRRMAQTTCHDTHTHRYPVCQRACHPEKSTLVYYGRA